MFEICSIKDYITDNKYYLQEEFLDKNINYTRNTLTYDEVLIDLRELVTLVGNKPIVFQT